MLAWHMGRILGYMYLYLSFTISSRDWCMLHWDVQHCTEVLVRKVAIFQFLQYTHLFTLRGTLSEEELHTCTQIQHSIMHRAMSFFLHFRMANLNLIALYMEPILHFFINRCVVTEESKWRGIRSYRNSIQKSIHHGSTNSTCLDNRNLDPADIAMWKWT